MLVGGACQEGFERLPVDQQAASRHAIRFKVAESHPTSNGSLAYLGEFCGLARPKVAGLSAVCC